MEYTPLIRLRTARQKERWMPRMDRRTFIETAMALGATAAWASSLGSNSNVAWSDRREHFPEGVASGDPDSTSVLLWTRRPYGAQDPGINLRAEIAEDSAFHRVMATAEAPVSGGRTGPAVCSSVD